MRIDERLEKFRSMSEEERKEELLSDLSDCVRMLAKHVAITRRSFVLEFGEEETFDRAYNRELEKANQKFKNMSKSELSIHMLLSMIEMGDERAISEKE